MLYEFEGVWDGFDFIYCVILDYFKVPFYADTCWNWKSETIDDSSIAWKCGSVFVV